jgi:hypothetical protein
MCLVHCLNPYLQFDYLLVQPAARLGSDYVATTVHLQRKTSSLSVARTLIASRGILGHNFRFAADRP